MEAFSCSTTISFINVSKNALSPTRISGNRDSILYFNLRNSRRSKNHSNLAKLSRHISSETRASSVPVSASHPLSPSLSSSAGKRHWMVHVDKPPKGIKSKADIIDYYVKTLERVLGNEKDAQMRIYDVSCDTNFGFCCDIDEETSRQLARLSGVISIRPDPDYNSEEKDYSLLSQFDDHSDSRLGYVPLFSPGTTEHWLVRIDKPAVEVVTKAQMVDYCAQLLSKVLGNERDAQMCIYHVSWQYQIGFCCDLDEECARELAGVPGVVNVVPDKSFESQSKDYGGKDTDNAMLLQDSSQVPLKTKKLFITGLSFYTSEKTLRAAFEGFGELVEVKIIMDKISKRSKGYAFVEYTTEEAASTALKEMNGKIINGWMIVVDVAKSKPSKYSQSQPRPQFASWAKGA